jgi:hypothetical protein
MVIFVDTELDCLAVMEVQVQLRALLGQQAAAGGGGGGGRGGGSGGGDNQHADISPHTMDSFISSSSSSSNGSSAYIPLEDLPYPVCLPSSGSAWSTAAARAPVPGAVAAKPQVLLLQQKLFQAKRDWADAVAAAAAAAAAGARFATKHHNSILNPAAAASRDSGGLAGATVGTTEPQGLELLLPGAQVAIMGFEGLGEVDDNEYGTVGSEGLALAEEVVKLLGPAVCMYKQWDEEGLVAQQSQQQPQVGLGHQAVTSAMGNGGASNSNYSSGFAAAAAAAGGGAAGGGGGEVYGPSSPAGVLGPASILQRYGWQALYAQLTDRIYPWHVVGLVRFSDFYSEVLEVYEDPDTKREVCSTGWPLLDDFYKVGEGEGGREGTSKKCPETLRSTHVRCTTTLAGLVLYQAACDVWERYLHGLSWHRSHP